MKKNPFIFVAIILIALSSYYYGINRGAKAATDINTLQLGIRTVDQMVLNSALLLSLKNENSETALKIAKKLVENDVKHLDKIEGMLNKIKLNEVDKNAFQTSINEARVNHKLANDL